MNVKKVLAYMVAVIALSAAGTAGDFELLPVGILMVSIIGAVISVLVGLLTKKYRAARLFGVVVMLSLLAVIVDLVISDRQQEKTEQTAVQVITAIERYRSAHGVLPASLDRLVPEQLAQVPTARNNNRFMYEVRSNDFSLSFSMPVFMVRTYDSKTRKWSTHD